MKDPNERFCSPYDLKSMNLVDRVFSGERGEYRERPSSGVPRPGSAYDLQSLHLPGAIRRTREELIRRGYFVR